MEANGEKKAKANLQLPKCLLKSLSFVLNIHEKQKERERNCLINTIQQRTWNSREI